MLCLHPSSLKIAMAHAAAITGILTASTIPIREIEPSEWKLLTTGRGDVTKEAVQAAMELLYTADLSAHPLTSPTPSPSPRLLTRRCELARPRFDRLYWLG